MVGTLDDTFKPILRGIGVRLIHRKPRTPNALKFASGNPGAANPQQKRLPLRGSEAGGAVVNDSPVDCQSRDLTEPAGETVAAEQTEGVKFLSFNINRSPHPPLRGPPSPKGEGIVRLIHLPRTPNALKFTSGNPGVVPLLQQEKVF